MATQTPPPSKPVITADDYSSLPKVISWLLIVTEAFAVLGKCVTLGWMRRFRWFSADNVLIVLSLAFSIALVVSVSLASTYGLGQRHSASDEYERLLYASNLFYILTLVASKLAVLLLLWALTPNVVHRRLMLGTGLLIILWSVSSLFVAAFECSLPQPWGGVCIQRYAFWIWFDVFNILTEVCLVTLPCHIIYKLQSSTSKKVSVMSAFMLRLVVIGAAIAEIYYRGQSDSTFDQWRVWVCVLFVQASSIIFACVPFMKPFFSSLESGFVRTDDVRRIGSRQKTFAPVRNLAFWQTQNRRTGNNKTKDGQNVAPGPGQGVGDRSQHLTTEGNTMISGSETTPLAAREQTTTSGTSLER